MKQSVGTFEYAEHICKSLKKGVLMTTAADGFVNTMTIGWGKLGMEWYRPIFIAYVRESRYTKQMLDKNGEFTINIPLGEYDSKILSHCGVKSGRDTDKIRDLGLHMEPSEHISVPGIKELPLTLECKVIYQQKQDISVLPQDILNRYYPVVGENGFRDPHIAYYGEIVNAYLITE